MNNPIHATRRAALQVGYSGLLGLGLSDLCAKSAQADVDFPGTGRAKSVILVFQTGAPSHQDIWDLKPNAPAEIRGEFTPVETSVPGILVGPHIPRLAAIAQKYAIVRSMTHDLPGHEQATHFVLSGINRLPPGSTHMASRNDWPCYAS